MEIRIEKEPEGTVAMLDFSGEDNSCTGRWLGEGSYKWREIMETVRATTEQNSLDLSSKLYFHTDSIWIYNNDILKTKCVKNEAIDLIVTSPPYNVDIKYNSHDDKIMMII